MRFLLLILPIALALYAIIDCARTPEESLPGKLPRMIWIVLIILAPALGPIAWIITSRVTRAMENNGRVEPRLWSSPDGQSLRFSRPSAPAPSAPDDDPEFLRQIAQEVRRSRWEETHRPADPELPADPAPNEGAKNGQPPLDLDLTDPDALEWEVVAGLNEDEDLDSLEWDVSELTDEEFSADGGANSASSAEDTDPAQSTDSNGSTDTKDTDTPDNSAEPKHQ